MLLDADENFVNMLFTFSIKTHLIVRGQRWINLIYFWRFDTKWEVFQKSDFDVRFPTPEIAKNTFKATKLLIHFVYCNSRQVYKIVFVPRKIPNVAFITSENKIQLKFTNKWAKNFSDAKLRKEKTLEIINFKWMNMYTFRWETRQSGFCFGLVGFMNFVTTVEGSSENLYGNRFLGKW